MSVGRRWRFCDLAAEAERDEQNESSVIFPAGGQADFILTILRAWRAGRVVCPLEPGQVPPAFAWDLPEDVVHLKTTSATTGAPRLVAFTASQLLADAQNILETMGLRPDWPNVGLISLAHSYGFSNLVLPLLLHGIPLILSDSALPESLRRAATSFPDITVAGVPALWQAWHGALAIPANVRLAISAGTPLSSALEQSVFAHQGLKIHNFYGSSECGGIAYDATTVPRPDPACAGAPLRHVEVRVGENGCLAVRSEAVAKGYWPQPGPGLSEGVFRTSDLGEIKSGLVYLNGRASDQINVAGRKVSPESIEDVLRSHAGVRECVVFGVPGVDQQRGELIVACISADPALKPENLKQYVLAQLPAWQVPRDWWFLEDLAASARGKVSRAEWRKRFLERNRS